MYMEAFGISRDIGTSGFPGGSNGKETDSNAGDPDLIPGSEIYPREENGNPLQYSCLENSIDRRAWQATVHGAPRSWTSIVYSLSLFFHRKIRELERKVDNTNCSLCSISCQY